MRDIGQRDFTYLVPKWTVLGQFYAASLNTCMSMMSCSIWLWSPLSKQTTGKLWCL